MAKRVLRCGDLMPGCEFQAEGASDEEVMKKAAAHAKEVHGIHEITPELATKVKGAIKDG